MVATRSLASRRFWLAAVLALTWVVSAPANLAAQSGSTREQPVSPPAAPADPSFLDMELTDLLRVGVLDIDVLGVHTHLAGQWMFGYKVMPMRMEGSRQGTTRITTADVLREFPVAPTAMASEMHMFEAMFAPSDALTLMAMVPYQRLSMTHLTRSGREFSTESAGVGDLAVTALYSAVGHVRRDAHRLVARGGLSFPTGSIDQRGDTPMGRQQKLPYPMQLGSGTYDALPGISYFGQSGGWAWEAEAGGIVRLGTNAAGYRLGHQVDAAVSVTRRATRWLAPSVQLGMVSWGRVRGADPELNPMMAPTADPARRGGTRMTMSVGVDVYLGGGDLEGTRFGLLIGVPVMQSLDGPQLQGRWHLTAGWNWTF